MNWSIFETQQKTIAKYMKQFMSYGFGPRRARNFARNLTVIRTKRRPMR